MIGIGCNVCRRLLFKPPLKVHSRTLGQPSAGGIGSAIALVARRHLVVLLPGGVLPAEPAYAALPDALDERAHAVAKDLEVYSGDDPPTNYSLGIEVDGILREADAHCFDRFHLVGYSAAWPSGCP